MRSILLTALTLAPGLLAACGAGDDGSTDVTDEMVDCSLEAPHDEFVAGISKPGMGGHYDFALMAADPAPPSRGDNAWLLQISAGGAPVSGATISIDSFMPKHGHHSTVPVDITPAATAGQYELAPVNLWMPGVWEITLDATVDDTTDTTVFKFCLPS